MKSAFAEIIAGLVADDQTGVPELGVHESDAGEGYVNIRLDSTGEVAVPSLRVRAALAMLGQFCWPPTGSSAVRHWADPTGR